MGKIVRSCTGAGLQHSCMTAFSDSAALKIADVAEHEGCDLIFMGSHGRRGLSRLLAGSETQKVLAGADVPVMVLRPKPAAG